MWHEEEGGGNYILLTTALKEEGLETSSLRKVSELASQNSKGLSL